MVDTLMWKSYDPLNKVLSFIAKDLTQPSCASMAKMHDMYFKFHT
jgi:hypothetical protein